MTTAAARNLEVSGVSLRIVTPPDIAEAMKGISGAAEPPAVRFPTRRERSNWALSLGASIALHATVAAIFLINWSHKHPEQAAPPAAIVVDLAVMPSSPPVPIRDVAPGPQQVEAAPKPQTRPDPQFDPPPKVDPLLKPAFAVPLKTEAQPTETKAQADQAHQTTAPQAIEAPKEKDDKAPVEGASTAAPSDAEQAWEGKVLAKLQRNKRYPVQAQSSGQEDTVMVRMLLDRRGRLLRAAIMKSRGFGLLDDEVLQLARRAGPYPAPPESVVGDPITLVVPVEFFIKRGR